mgnify:CR=1 FL=1
MRKDVGQHRSDVRQVERAGHANLQRASRHRGIGPRDRLGFLDVFHLAGGRATVVDYKTNTLAEGTPEEIVEADYRLQRLVYALACFRAGAEEVEVVYHFLERPDAVVSTRFTAESYFYPEGSKPVAKVVKPPSFEIITFAALISCSISSE